ncbi:MAG TPA: hypothetical protein P5081_05940 [Phycisphaerae bacterium]|nr:hypothetical protein [Phycisphaerae bacterium]HRW52408.1 hypothetical protein [Phycisphaerae bacterium]
MSSDQPDVNSVDYALQFPSRRRPIVSVITHLMWITMLCMNAYCYAYYFPLVRQRPGDAGWIPYAVALMEATAIASIFNVLCVVLILKRRRPIWPLLLCIALSVPLCRDAYLCFF